MADGVPVELTVSEPLPLEAAAGDEFSLTVRAASADGRDRTGLMLDVIAPDGTVAPRPFAAHQDGVSETGTIALHAPAQIGLNVFRLSLPAHEIAGTRYAEAALDVPVRVRAQATSLAAWDVPSPVVAGRRFTVKAGAKSTANRPLAGLAIEIRDAAGAMAGRGQLGATPWPGTDALYWTEIELTAPPHAGPATWSIRFEASELDLPHESSATSFRAMVVPAPEHRLKIKVVEQATAAPLADVELRLGAYRGTTGPTGLAEIALPKGRYQLSVWKAGYDAPPRPVEIGADAFVEIEALTVAEEDPDARWKM